MQLTLALLTSTRLLHHGYWCDSEIGFSCLIAGNVFSQNSAVCLLMSTPFHRESGILTLRFYGRRLTPEHNLDDPADSP